MTKIYYILDFFYPKLEDSTWEDITDKSIFLWSFDNEGYFSDE
jgi:hypothetical protein